MVTTVVHTGHLGVLVCIPDAYSVGPGFQSSTPITTILTEVVFFQSLQRDIKIASLQIFSNLLFTDCHSTIYSLIYIQHS
jgi:hypothetical protein